MYIDIDVVPKQIKSLTYYSNAMKTHFYFDFQQAFQTSWIDRKINKENLSINNLSLFTCKRVIRKKLLKK